MNSCLSEVTSDIIYPVHKYFRREPRGTLIIGASALNRANTQYAVILKVDFLVGKRSFFLFLL